MSGGTDAELIAALRRLGRTSEEILAHGEMMRLVLSLYRADSELCETWHYASEPPLAIPISAFGGLADPDVTRDELEAWGHETIADFGLHLMPGGHFFLHPDGSRVLSLIAADLLANVVERAGRHA